MDAKKCSEAPTEMPRAGIAADGADSLEASIRRAQEVLSAVSARLASRGPAAGPAAERFIEADAMQPAEARAVAERCMAGEPQDLSLIHI